MMGPLGLGPAAWTPGPKVRAPGLTQGVWGAEPPPLRLQGAKKSPKGIYRVGPSGPWDPLDKGPKEPKGAQGAPGAYVCYSNQMKTKDSLQSLRNPVPIDIGSQAPDPSRRFLGIQTGLLDVECRSETSVRRRNSPRIFPEGSRGMV